MVKKFSFVFALLMTFLIIGKADAAANVAAIERAAFQAERDLRGYSGIADVSIQVAKNMDKTIVIALMVDEGTDKGTALDKGELAINVFTKHAIAEGVETTPPTSNHYGSLFSEYNIYLGIFTYSTRGEKSKWYYEHVIIGGYKNQGPGSPHRRS